MPPGNPEDPTGDPVAVGKAICLRLLAIAPRPRAGLALALRHKGIPEGAAEVVLDRLTEVGLIDDSAYAEAFVRAKHRDRGLGRQALRAELARKGVDRELVTEAVAQLDDGAEGDRIRQLVERRIDAAMAAGPDAARRRLLGMLARRGYPGDSAIAAVDAAIESHLTEG